MKKKLFAKLVTKVSSSVEIQAEETVENIFGAEKTYLAIDKFNDRHIALVKSSLTRDQYYIEMGDEPFLKVGSRFAPQDGYVCTRELDPVDAARKYVRLNVLVRKNKDLSNTELIEMLNNN